MQSSSLSRTSSAASISSDDGAYVKQLLGLEPRRTRKRFSSAQLVLLEQLFHQTSHPTRDEREAVARAAGMEMKSVTIWFQNKRQTERKALHHPGVSLPSSSPTPFYASASTSASAASAMTSTPHSIHTARTLSTPLRKHTPPRARPSLDRIATRSESRLPPPRTPTRPRDPHASLWDNMPSSPLAAPASPPARDLVEFLGGSRTLEWACAAARLAGKEGRRRTRDREHREGEREGVRERTREKSRRSRDRDEGELTEEDDVEAVTPQGSFGASDAARWHGHGAHARPRLASMPASDPAPELGNLRWSYADGSGKEVPQDEDMMRAALALCGLGRRTG